VNYLADLRCYRAFEGPAIGFVASKCRSCPTRRRRMKP